jgi:hypothetical protein
MCPPSSNHKSSPSPARVFSPDWWVRDQNGGLTLAQWPNPALAVWLVTVVVVWTGVLGAARTATFADVGRGALVVWALDELLRGVNPVRRLLGAIVFVVQLIGLLA